MAGKLLRLAAHERVTAARYNALVDAVNHLLQSSATGLHASHGPAGVHYAIGGGARLELIVLGDTLEAHQVDGEGSILAFDKDEEDDKWAASSRQVTQLADLQESAYLPGERRVCCFSSAAGKWLPMDAVQWHIGELGDDLQHGESATVTLWMQNDDASFGSTSLQVTAYDWLLPAGKFLPGGARVVVMQLVRSRTWVVVATDTCPEDIDE